MELSDAMKIHSVGNHSIRSLHGKASSLNHVNTTAESCEEPIINPANIKSEPITSDYDVATQHVKPAEIKCEPITSDYDVATQHVKPAEIKCEPITSDYDVATQHVKPAEIKCEPRLRDVTLNCEGRQSKRKIRVSKMKSKQLGAADCDILQQDLPELSKYDESGEANLHFDGNFFRHSIFDPDPNPTISGNEPAECVAEQAASDDEPAARDNACNESKDKKFQCRECSKSFSVKSYLLRHMHFVHIGLRKFECKMCGKYFKTKQTLTNHSATHSETSPFECKVCSKKFKSQKLLSSHSAIHSEVRRFVCQICGKGFKHQSVLYGHMEVHSDFRPMECNICGNKFKTKRALSSHALVHSDIKPFECDQCGLKFKLHKLLSKHIRQWHTQPEWVLTQDS